MSKPERSYRWLMWTLVLLGLSLDQFSKYHVFQWLYNEGRGGLWTVLEGKFELLAEYVPNEESVDPNSASSAAQPVVRPKVNQGALFGLGNKQKSLANTFFAVVSIAAGLAIMYWSTRRTTARDGVLCAALGLILAGTLGNLYDRLVFNGVRDFLHFYWFEFPVFNVADCCLVCGASLLLLQAFLCAPATARESSGEVAYSAAAAQK